MTFDIELNIKKCTVELVHALEELGVKNNYKVLHHGWDRLVFIGGIDDNFTRLVYELRAKCRVNGIDFTDLQILD